jgi:hypothetical protein
MHRITAKTGVALGAVALALGAAAPAHAGPASGTPLLIHEQLDFGAQSFTFTASDPLCPAGTFSDDVVDGRSLDRNGTVYQLTIDTVYTCDDGSGTFSAQKVIVLRGRSDGSARSSGTFRLTGGTGDYSGISGQGTDVGGTNADGVGGSTIRGALTPR